MGVVLTLGLVLAFTEFAIELYVVFMFRPEKFNPSDYNPVNRFFMRYLHRLGPWVERSEFNSFVFSIGLSVGLGMFWPVAGAAAAVGAMLSTLMTMPVYWVRRRIRHFNTLRQLHPSLSTFRTLRMMRSVPASRSHTHAPLH